jgi:hypothetical protein
MKRTPPQILGYISEDSQASRSGVTVSTLRRWRGRGYGPRWEKFGRFVLYAEDANQRFIEEEAAAAEAQRQPRRPGRPRLQRSSPSDPRPPLAAASQD